MHTASPWLGPAGTAGPACIKEHDWGRKTRCPPYIVGILGVPYLRWHTSPRELEQMWNAMHDLTDDSPVHPSERDGLDIT